jgi:hypothetical protein
MSKADAVAVIFSNCKMERQPNPREFRQLIRSLERLGLDPEETREACQYLDICDRHGHLWRADLAPLAPWAAAAPTVPLKRQNEETNK